MARDIKVDQQSCKMMADLDPPSPSITFKRRVVLEGQNAWCIDDDYRNINGFKIRLNDVFYRDFNHDNYLDVLVIVYSYGGGTAFGTAIFVLTRYAPDGRLYRVWDFSTPYRLTYEPKFGVEPDDKD